MQATSPTSVALQAFELINNVQLFAGLYRMHRTHAGAREVTYQVSDQAGLDHAALRAMFLEDMATPSRPVDWTGDKWDADEPDYATHLTLDYLKPRESVSASAAPLDKTYLVFAKDAQGRVVGYTAATVSLWFMLPGADVDEDEPSLEDVASWLLTSKRSTLKAFLKISVHETYTLASHRGQGASSATMEYLGYLFMQNVNSTITALQGPLRAHGKKLELSFDLYAEWESKSGCLAAGTLLAQLEAGVRGLRRHYRGKGLPVKLPKTVTYDAGF